MVLDVSGSGVFVGGARCVDVLRVWCVRGKGVVTIGCLYSVVYG